MHPARIAELLQPFLGPAPTPKTQDLIPSISTYIDILLRWNARINLTAIRDPEEIVTRHFGESLFAARMLFPRADAEREGHGFSRAAALPEKTRALAPEGAANDQRPATNDHPTVADIGSGAGFPGLPIKLWVPEIHLTLIESNHKKATFLREVARALTLTDIDIQNTRAESISPATFDVVTLRAVERFEQVLPTAATLVAPGGCLALLIGTAQLAQATLTLPHLTWSNPEPISLSRSRVLVTARREP